MQLYFLSTWVKDLCADEYIEAFYAGDKKWNRHIEKAAMLSFEEAMHIASVEQGGCYLNWFEEGTERKQSKLSEQENAIS